MQFLWENLVHRQLIGKCGLINWVDNVNCRCEEFPKLIFRALALCQNERLRAIVWKVSFKTLNGGQFISTSQLTNQIILNFNCVKKIKYETNFIQISHFCRPKLTTKGQQNGSKMPSNIFAKQIVFPAYETNVSTSFFIPANELKIQHLFILHLFLNSSKTACIGSIQDIWRIWVWSVCYRLGSNIVQELPLPNTAVKGQACARGSILVGCMAISRVKFQGKHEK